MEATEPDERSDAPDDLRGAVKWSIVVKREVSTRPVIIGGVIRQQTTKVTLPQHYDMVEALASNRTDQPLDMAVLPWRAGRDGPISNAHGSQAPSEWQEKSRYRGHGSGNAVLGPKEMPQ